MTSLGAVRASGYVKPSDIALKRQALNLADRPLNGIFVVNSGRTPYADVNSGGTHMGDQALQNAHRIRDEAVARLERARADLAQAQEAIAVAKADLEKVNGFITLWHSFAEYDKALPIPGELHSEEAPLSEHEGVASLETAQEPRRGKRPRGNPKKEAVAAVAREIIAANGVPMLRAPLFAAVRERGFDIKGADPEMVFSTMLWRVPTAVVRLPDFGYWLTEVPFEPAGYVPGVQRTMIDKEEYDMVMAEGSGRLPDTDSDDGSVVDDNAPSPDDLRDAALERAADDRRSTSERIEEFG